MYTKMERPHSPNNSERRGTERGAPPSVQVSCRGTVIETVRSRRGGRAQQDGTEEPESHPPEHDPVTLDEGTTESSPFSINGAGAKA